MKVFASITAALLVLIAPARAQVTGEPVPPTEQEPEEPMTAGDSLYIFTPARPLIDSTANRDRYDDAFGIDVLFSNSGFGLGGFYQRPLSEGVSAFINLGITGTRKSDEFPQFIPDPGSSYRGRYDIPGKVNRVFTLPLTLGVNYRLFRKSLVDNFRPYVNAGAGPTLILALPYRYEFFSSILHTSAFVTAGGFVGAGAEFGGSQPSLGINVRYYYIPYGPGVESLQDEPITDFGGLFLTLNVGFFR